MTLPRIRDIVLRALLTAFCVLTSLYAFVASSAFAEQQFLKPRVFAWVGVFSDWHPAAACVALGLLTTVVWRDLTRGGMLRIGAASLLGLGAAASAFVVVHPVLPTLTAGPGSIVVGVLALVPLVGLAALDHLRFAARFNGPVDPLSEGARAGAEGRLFVVCLGTAVVVTAIYTVRASLVMTGVFEPDLMTWGLLVGFAFSLMNHWLIASVAFLALALVNRACAGRPALQHIALSAMFITVFALAFQRLIGSALSLSGVSGVLAAWMSSLALVTTWSGVRLARVARQERTCHGALDLFFHAPAARGSSAWHAARPFAALTIVAMALAFAAGWLDWDFVLLNTGVLLVWVLGFGALYRSVPPQLQVGTLAMVAALLSPLVGHAALERSPDTARVLGRYAVYNPSFRLSDSLLGGGPSVSAFDRYLRAHTGFTDVAAEPVRIDFVPALSERPASEKPHIFLFVIDSLRRDYLSPYNPAVSFTPRLAEFAAENLAFRNAFTRYGGTGMSMPAIWAGSALLHKQYVEPFHPMNALEKLLDANRYRKAYSFDHISTQLVRASDDTIELDRGRPEMEFDFCRTTGEIRETLDAMGPPPDPLFAHTRSLNLHVWEVRKSAVPPEPYPGFYPQYAARVRRIDACFGAFVDDLKRRKLYDRSVIVFTADHGELLGEDSQWGHSYHLFPPVVQIPLLIHVPSTVRTADVDLDALAFSTDITPTLYAALGYTPHRTDTLAGQSLISPHGSPEFTDNAGIETLAASRVHARRRGRFVVSASYGAVYGVVSENGRRFYIANAINGTEQAYERPSVGGSEWANVVVSEEVRMLGQAEIRRHVDEVARAYRVNPAW